MKIVLEVTKGPEQGRVFEFVEPRGFIIGRSRQADFSLSPDDPYVSRRHVFLEICPPSCRLKDLDSANPPRINGQVFTEKTLADGDIVEVGYTRLKVSIEDQIILQTWTCPGCGGQQEFLPDETVPNFCETCLEQKRSAIRYPQKRIKASCADCRADLTDKANSEGRAGERPDAAHYVCERCVRIEAAFAGHVVGDYEIMRSLGEGGMGKVYQVYHRPTARVMALKQMKDLTHKVLVKRFNREVKLLTRLAHANIIQYIDSGIDAQGEPYCVTEYVAGGDLEDLMVRSGGCLKLQQSLHIIDGVLQGLDYLHAQSIIHRDLKPQNILLDSALSGGTTNGSLVPKITDFGLAYSYQRAGGTRLTKPRTAMGTLMFMSPEQIHSADTVRAPADIYSVGVTLYYLLTGKYTFNFPTAADIEAFKRKNPGRWKNTQEAFQALKQRQRIQFPFQIILSEEPVPILDRDASLPVGLASVVDRAVRKDPKRRFQKAAVFRRALQEAMGRG